MAAGKPQALPSQQFLVRTKTNRIGRPPEYELEPIGEDGKFPDIGDRLRPALSELESAKQRKNVGDALALIAKFAPREQQGGMMSLIDSLAQAIWTLDHLEDMRPEVRLQLQDAIGTLTGVWPNERLTRDELIERLVD